MAMCMSSDLSRPSKQRKAAKGCHLPGVGPSGVVLLVPPLCLPSLLIATAKGNQICVKADPAFLSQRLLLFAFFKNILHFLSLSS